MDAHSPGGPFVARITEKSMKALYLLVKLPVGPFV